MLFLLFSCNLKYDDDNDNDDNGDDGNDNFDGDCNELEVLLSLFSPRLKEGQTKGDEEEDDDDTDDNLFRFCSGVNGTK